MSDKTAETSVSPKVDPETLVLRAKPGGVVRFRRPVIVGAAAFASALLAGTAWLALQPTSFRIAGEGPDHAASASKLPADALDKAPRSYSDVPQLGRPLPGDLGRPILAHERATGAVLAPPDPAAQAADAERQRSAAEQRAARESVLLVQIGGGRATQASGNAAGAMLPSSAGGAGADREMLDPAGGPSAPRRQAGLTGAGDGEADISPHRMIAPASPWTLSAGSVIAAGLITGLNSDLPGFVTAQVTENVYDSATGRTLLIPQGARLIGRYDSKVAFGQARALVVWQRILLPDGSSIRIDNLPATDPSGQAGLADQVDRHGWQLLKGVALSTLLGLGTELSFGDGEGDLVRAIRESAQESGSRAGDRLVARTLDVPPTIRVRPGWPLRVVVHRDIILAPWTGGS